MTQVHIIVSGRVQGVFFRAYTSEKAIELGLKGWVRNTPDGRVEIMAIGDKSSLETFISWCHKGSPASHVDDLYVEWVDILQKFSNFSIKY